HGAASEEPRAEAFTHVPSLLPLGQVQDVDSRCRSAHNVLRGQRRVRRRGPMKRFLKWAAGLILLIAVCAFLAFLFFIPPFFTTPPEEFSKAVREAAPPVTDITDPAERLLAERGRYIVVGTGCIGFHAPNGPTGPDYSKYLAGGGLKITSARGTIVSRNLTPDKETGLGLRSDDEVKRV